jgi:hypothetical protein
LEGAGLAMSTGAGLATDVSPAGLEQAARGLEQAGLLGAAKQLRAAATRIRELEADHETRVSSPPASRPSAPPGATGGRFTLVIPAGGARGQLPVQLAIEDMALHAGCREGEVWGMTLSDFAERVTARR